MGFRDAARQMRRFQNDTSGVIAILFALSVIPILLVAGSALDFVQANDAKGKLQAALDAGALAAATAANLTDEERVDLAKKAFETNFALSKSSGMDAVPQFTINDGQVIATASTTMSTDFVRVVGIDAMDINAGVKINIPQIKDVEISLVLDFSGSMKETVGGDVKYTAMQEAATDLIEDLAFTGKAKFALVPFSHHVYLTMPSKYVAGQPLTGNWTGCTQDRTYDHNLTDGTPDQDDDSTKWGQPQAPVHIADGCGPYAANQLELVPLTDDADEVTTKLQAMQPNAWTHIPLGLEFGWQTLSPNGIFAADVAPYNDDDTQKWIVLLTDGAQTEPAFGPGGVRNVSQGNSNLTALCDEIKGEGVRIVTVAYDLDDVPTINRLRGCASPNEEGEQMFYQPGGGTPISEVFDDIKKQLAQAIFISE